MVYFVFDNPADKDRMKFLMNYQTKEFRQIYPEHRLDSRKEMLIFVSSFVGKTSSEDTIIFWYDFMGVICWWLCKIRKIERKIVILNLLLKDKNTIKNRLAKILYKYPLKDEKVTTTVTAKEYGVWINNVLRLNKKHNLIHDIYYGDESVIEGKENTVFCGGRNGRDWYQLIDIAKKLKEVTFNCVMPRNKYEEMKSFFTPNMYVRCDISEKEFLSMLQSSFLIVIPLDTEAPAGLVVLFQSGMYQKLVITSDTVTTREYFTEDRGVLCIDDWTEKIKYYLSHPIEAESKAKNFRSFLNRECSRNIYADKLYSLIKGE